MLTFWDDIGELYATPGVPFKLSYAGRVVGSGVVDLTVRPEP
jgi:hypothetical protein